MDPTENATTTESTATTGCCGASPDAGTSETPEAQTPETTGSATPTPTFGCC